MNQNKTPLRTIHNLPTATSTYVFVANSVFHNYLIL